MPQAVQADWPLIQQLYMAGKPVQEISAETGVKQGTISARASRARWSATATKAMQVLQGAKVTNEPDSESGLSTVSQPQATSRSRAALSKRFAETIEKLSALPIPKSLSAVQREHKALQPLVQNTACVEGWQDSSHSPPAVRISIMSASTLVSVENKASFVADSEGVTTSDDPLLGHTSSRHTSPENFPILEVSATPMSDPDDSYSI